MEQLCAKSYLDHGHEFHLYCYGPCAGVPPGVVVKDATEILPESDISKYRYLAHFADMFRYNLLYKKGGWWVDADTVCLKPFDMPDEHVFAEEIHPDFFCNNAYIKAPAGSEIMKWMIEESKKFDPKTMPWAAIACDLLTEAVKKFKAKSFSPDTFNPTFPPNWREFVNAKTYIPPESAYAVHFWRQGWKWENQDREIKFPATSFFEQLKHKHGIGVEQEPVQSLWIGNQLGTMEQLSIYSFLGQGHPFHLYLYDECEGVPKGVLVKDANEVMPRSTKDSYVLSSMFSDAFRYRLLQLGRSPWWVDLDVVCLRPFDFKEPLVISCEEFPYKSGTMLANGCVLKSQPNSAFLLRAISKCEELEALVNKRGGKIGGLQVGPDLVTEIVNNLNLWDFVKPREIFNPVPWQELAKNMITENFTQTLSTSYAVHLFNNAWDKFRRGSKEETYPKTSLYGRLQDMYFPKDFESPAIPSNHQILFRDGWILEADEKGKIIKKIKNTRVS
jgi:hypothetical protein